MMLWAWQILNISPSFLLLTKLNVLICYRLQLVDVLGAAQTADSHEAALKILDFQSEESLDLNERYLWSLSFGSHPVPHIIKGTYSYQN